MSDEIDRVQDAQAIHITAALSRISANIPAGVRGECEECGAEMPRLVGGRCGFCRDGRRPPLDRYPDLAPIAPEAPRLDAPQVVQAATAPAPGVPKPEEEDAMSTPNCKVTIEGAAFEAVKARAEAQDIPLKQAATDLIELGAGATDSGAADVMVAHSDDAAVDRFAANMKAKLADAREKGRGGWDDPAQCSTGHLCDLLHEHVAKGDPVDVANFAMMLSHYGASIVASRRQPEQPIKADTADLSDDELLAELRQRLDGDATAISAAVARAERAEAQLTAIRQTVLGTESQG